MILPTNSINEHAEILFLMSKETVVTKANSNKQKLKDQKILLTGFLAEVTFFSGGLKTKGDYRNVSVEQVSERLRVIRF